MRPTTCHRSSRPNTPSRSEPAAELRGAFAVGVVFTLVVSTLALGCGRSKADAERRAAPLPRHEVTISAKSPVRLFTSRRGPQPAGRPQAVLLSFDLTRGVLSIATEVLGIDGIEVVGGQRLNHGSSSRTRRLQRAITARLLPQSRGSLLINVTWRTSIDGAEHRTQVALPLPAKQEPAPVP